MPKEIEKKVKDFIKKQGISKKDKIVVALSGGADSMCLLSTLKNLGHNLVACHINHRLRKEAQKDEDFLKQYCANKSIPFQSCKITLKNKTSFETEAREKRYKELQSILEKVDGDWIATAHHLNDSLETFILNLARGTGIKGLTGVPEKRDNIIRPLSNCYKEEIFEFLKKNKIPFCHDKSNSDQSIARNFIRHSIIPKLKTLNPEIEKTFSQTKQNLLESTALISEQVNKWIDDNNCGNPLFYTFEKDKLIEISEVLQKEVFRKIYTSLNKTVISQSHLREITKLLKKKNGTKSFGKNWKLSIYKDQVSIKPVNPKKIYQKLKVTRVSKVNKLEDSLYIDGDKVRTKLTTRYFLPGDKFKPYGLKGSKKLKKFFNEKKVPANKRKTIPILIDGETIVAVGNFEISDNYKVLKSSKNIYKVSLD